MTRDFTNWIKNDVATKINLSSTDTIITLSDDEIKIIPATAFSTGGSGSGVNWTLENGNAPINTTNGSKLIVTPSVATINLPIAPSIGYEVNLIGSGITANNYVTLANCGKLEGSNVDVLRLTTPNKVASLIYINPTVGWIRSGEISAFTAIGSFYTSTFQSSGDTNGVFYYIGTNKLSESFANPHTAGRVNVTVSSDLFQTGVNPICDRVNNTFHSNYSSDSWVNIDLLANKNLKLSYYSIRSRADDNQQHLRNWVIEGSNDNTIWDILDTQTNNTQLNNAGVWVNISVVSNTAYRYFKLRQTGANSSGQLYLTLSELELYGELIWS